MSILKLTTCAKVSSKRSEVWMVALFSVDRFSPEPKRNFHLLETGSGLALALESPMCVCDAIVRPSDSPPTLITESVRRGPLKRGTPSQPVNDCGTLLFILSSSSCFFSSCPASTQDAKTKCSICPPFKEDAVSLWQCQNIRQFQFQTRLLWPRIPGRSEDCPVYHILPTSAHSSN